MQSHIPGGQARQSIIEGNHRFVNQGLSTTEWTTEERQKFATGQQPKAAILACADSRVAPEYVFDQDFGELFVVRVAGNVADPAGIGSLEYAVSALNVPLIVILGHENCGAVDAAQKGAVLPSHLGQLVDQIKENLKSEDLSTIGLEQAIHKNIQVNCQKLIAQSKIISDAVNDGSLQVVGAYYKISDGEVSFLT